MPVYGKKEKKKETKTLKILLDRFKLLERTYKKTDRVKTSNRLLVMPGRLSSVLFLAHSFRLLFVCVALWSSITCPGRGST